MFVSRLLDEFDRCSSRDAFKISRRCLLGASVAGLTACVVGREQVARATPAATSSQSHKAVIHIYLNGGPSHLDTFDLKPSAPAEYRGEFQPIATKVPGIEICELLPRMAASMDRMSILRAVVANEQHCDAQTATGYSSRVKRMGEHPSFGAVVSKKLGPVRDGIPPFVSLRAERWLKTDAADFVHSTGPFGPSHRPFVPDEQGLSNLQLRREVTLRRWADRQSLLVQFDPTIRGSDSLTAKAIDLISSGTLSKAFDVSREPEKVRERYGSTWPFTNYSKPPGTSMLAARRLIEAGVRCVCMGFVGWDTHVNNFKTLRTTLPLIDQAVTALIDDLHERGLDQDVAVIMWGEFGRTPIINKDGGRDHWEPVMSALIAGGGMKMGQVIGSTTSRGEAPKDRPYTVSQVLSTLYHNMGIDPAATFINSSGRPIHILGDRQFVTELL